MVIRQILPIAENAVAEVSEYKKRGMQPEQARHQSGLFALS